VIGGTRLPTVKRPGSQRRAPRCHPVPLVGAGPVEPRPREPPPVPVTAAKALRECAEATHHPRFSGCGLCLRRAMSRCQSPSRERDFSSTGGPVEATSRAPTGSERSSERPDLPAYGRVARTPTLLQIGTTVRLLRIAHNRRAAVNQRTTDQRIMRTRLRPPGRRA
jgi:hypothetical protein